MPYARNYVRRSPYRRRWHGRLRSRRRRISDLQILAAFLAVIIIVWLITSH